MELIFSVGRIVCLGLVEIRDILSLISDAPYVSIHSSSGGGFTGAQKTTGKYVGAWEVLTCEIVYQLTEDPFLGPHDLLSLAPSIRAEAVQDDLRARFCTAKYHEQFLIMRAILESEVVKYETMAYKCGDWVNDIKEKIKELEVLEGKKQRLQDVLMGAGSEFPILEAKVTAFDQHSKIGHDQILSFHTPPPPATTNPLDHQPAGASTSNLAEMARAQHQTEKMAAKRVSSFTTSGKGTGGSTTKKNSTNKPTTPTQMKLEYLYVVVSGWILVCGYFQLFSDLFWRLVLVPSVIYNEKLAGVW